MPDRSKSDRPPTTTDVTDLPVNRQADPHLSAQEAVEDVQGDARAKAAEVRGEAARQARRTGEALQEQARTTFGEVRHEIADRIDRFARVLRTSEDDLRSEGYGDVAPYPGRLADAIDDVTHYLRERDASGMRRDLERAVEARPGLVIGGLAAVGALAVWALKQARTEPLPREGVSVYGRR